MLDILLGQMELAELQRNESIWGKSSYSVLPCLLDMIEWDWPHDPHGPVDGEAVCPVCERCSEFLATFSKVLRWLSEKQPAKIKKFEYIEWATASLLGDTLTSDRSMAPSINVNKSKSAPDAARLLERLIDKFIGSLTVGSSASIAVSSIGGSAGIVWKLLDCLHLLIANGDSLRRYSTLDGFKDNTIPLVNKLVPKLWQVMDSSHAEIPRCATACILRCLTLSEESRQIFDLVLKRDFLHTDWLIRFDAVERAVNLCQLIRFEEVVKNQQILSSLALIAYHLALSIRDLNLTIVQRATVLMGALQANSIKTLVESLLFQFRFCIVDRLVVLDTLSLLAASLRAKHTIVSWDLVFQFIDALVAEIQANSDLLDPLEISEHDNRLDRARFALSHANMIKSVQLSVADIISSEASKLNTSSEDASHLLDRQQSASNSKKFLPTGKFLLNHLAFCFKYKSDGTGAILKLEIDNDTNDFIKLF